MAAPTTNLLLTNQDTGDNDNTWGDVVDAIFEIIDAKTGDMTTIATTSGTVALSTTQERVNVIKCTGTLVGNLTLEFSGRGGTWVIWNATSGAFTVTAKVSGQTGVVITQGTRKIVFCDATDMRDGLTDLVTTSGTNAFTGINSFSVAPRPSANDAAALGVSGTAWSDLFLASSGVINWGAGEVTLTASSNTIVLGGAILISLDSGTVINWGSGEVTLEASSNTMTLGGAIFVAENGGTFGDASGDTVVIKGTTVHANIAALWDSTTVAAYADTVIDSLGTEAKGSILYRDGSSWVMLPIGSTGQVLTVSQGEPVWS